MYVTTAKFNSKCAETGAKITKGEAILYDKEKKLVYCKSSNKFKEHESESEASSTAAMVQANEDAFTDNWSKYYL
jgi:hypothetical protein